MKSLAFVVALGASVACSFAQTGKGAPPDVPKDHWAYQAVDDLFRWGLLDGYPDGTFNGSRPATRYELAAGFDKVFQTTKDRLDSIKLAYAPAKDDLGDLRHQLSLLRDQVETVKAKKVDIDALFAVQAKLRTQLADLKQQLAALDANLKAETKTADGSH